MNGYLRWNDALAAHFFREDLAGRSIYLYVNQKLISDIGKGLSEDSGTFLDAVKEGPPWVSPGGLCHKALQSYAGWRSRNLNFPPYLAYLGLFVLAAGSEGDFDPNAYYPRLRRLLDEPGEGMVPSFHRMFQLWEDLEVWSALDKKGDLGLFRASRLGNHPHVGYPLRQSMLTERERKALPSVFYEAGLDPGSNSPADELARSLRGIGSKYLSRRTLRLLETQYDGDLYRALLDTVTEELAEWDGELQLVGPSGRTRVASANVRICLDVDETSNVARATLRCRLNREFPEEGLVVEVPGLPGRFQAEEYVGGWSLPLDSSVTRDVLDASRLNWSSGVVMRTDPAGWQLRMPGRPVRVFVDGKTEQIPGLVEAYALPQGRQFCVAFAGSFGPELERWATTQCRGFKRFHAMRGLPPTWQLAAIGEALDDEAIREVVPWMSFPASTRLRLVGGIRSGRGNEYFSFAPPKIEMEGGPANTAVYCDGRLLGPSGPAGLYELPRRLPAELRILVEARSGEDMLARESLFLTGDFSLPPQEPLIFVDRAGSAVESPREHEFAVAGAYVQNAPPWPQGSTATLLEDLKAEIGDCHGYLLGRIVGQIVPWPAGPFPDNWRPTWAIIMRNRVGKAYFIGDSIDGARPGRDSDAKKRSVRTWKDVVWYGRKRVTPPTLPVLRSLWKEYLEVGRRA